MKVGDYVMWNETATQGFARLEAHLRGVIVKFVHAEPIEGVTEGPGRLACIDWGDGRGYFTTANTCWLEWVGTQTAAERIAELEAELAEIKSSGQRMTFTHEWYLEGVRRSPGDYVLMRIGPAKETEILF